MRHELTLRFSIGDPISDRERLMRMVLDRKLEPERVVSHRMALDDAARAYQLFDQRIATSRFRAGAGRVACLPG